jgi:hypothetical protein
VVGEEREWGEGNGREEGRESERTGEIIRERQNVRLSHISLRRALRCV